MSITLCPKKVLHQTSHAVTLSILNVILNFSPLEKELNFQRKPYNTFHHTVSVLLHYLGKFETSNFGKSGRQVALLSQRGRAMLRVCQ